MKAHMHSFSIIRRQTNGPMSEFAILFVIARWNHCCSWCSSYYSNTVGWWTGRLRTGVRTDYWITTTLNKKKTHRNTLTQLYFIYLCSSEKLKCRSRFLICYILSNWHDVDINHVYTLIYIYVYIYIDGRIPFTLPIRCAVVLLFLERVGLWSGRGGEIRQQLRSLVDIQTYNPNIQT